MNGEKVICKECGEATYKQQIHCIHCQRPWNGFRVKSRDTKELQEKWENPGYYPMKLPQPLPENWDITKRELKDQLLINIYGVRRNFQGNLEERC